MSFFCGLGTSAQGANVTFTFNTLSENASAAQIAGYMTTTLETAGCSGCTVTMTGAVADTKYNGDGHVVGSNSQSLTLGTSNDATSNSSSTPSTTYDTFIANSSDSDVTVASQITLQFIGLAINGTVAFDYEIFPDGTCTQLSTKYCGGAATGGIYPNQPDLTFEAGTGTKGTDPLVTSFGTNGVRYGVTPGTTNGTSTHSPNSGSKNAELAPQYIGTWSGSLNNATELDFIDWPATIGIDNLTISWNTPSPIPEPASVLLLGTVLAGGLVLRLKRKARKI